MAEIKARQTGSRPPGPRVSRPCLPDDVVKVAENLSSSGKLDKNRLQILHVYGLRQTRPDGPGQYYFWTTAMDRLDWPLRTRGIVA